MMNRGRKIYEKKSAAAAVEFCVYHKLYLAVWLVSNGLKVGFEKRARRNGERGGGERKKRV